MVCDRGASGGYIRWVPLLVLTLSLVCRISHSTGAITCNQCQTCSGPNDYSGKQDAVLLNYAGGSSDLTSPQDLSTDTARQTPFGNATCDTPQTTAETTLVDECVTVYFTVKDYRSKDYTTLATCTLMARLEDLTTADSNEGGEVGAYGEADTVKNLLELKSTEADVVNASLTTCAKSDCNVVPPSDDTDLSITCGDKGNVNFSTEAVTATRDLLCNGIKIKLPAGTTCVSGETADVTSDVNAACVFHVKISLPSLSGIGESVLNTLMQATIADVKSNNENDALAQAITSDGGGAATTKSPTDSSDSTNTTTPTSAIVNTTTAAGNTKEVTLTTQMKFSKEAAAALEDAAIKKEVEKAFTDQLCGPLIEGIKGATCSASVNVKSSTRAKRSTDVFIEITFVMKMPSSEEANEETFTTRYKTEASALQNDDTFAQKLKQSLGDIEVDLRTLETEATVTIQETSAAMTTVINLTIITISPIIATKLRAIIE